MVPGGGLSADERRWVAARDGFFLPVRVLSRLFRGKYLAYLRRAYEAGEVVLAGRLEDLAQPGAWRAFLEPYPSRPSGSSTRSPPSARRRRC